MRHPALLFSLLLLLTGCRTTTTGFIATGDGGSLYYEERGSGHMLNMEQPEAFNKLILKFIKQK